MANFNTLFAGYESFMEGDIEINNDVTVPASADNEGEAIEAETTAEEMGAEGSDISGDIDEESAKTENANMVFDQLLNMYMHVKENGIDRTFLSLYNSDGQLNQMVGYKFPSCESMDSVGSPRSQASRAFIAAMEDEKEGIFKRFWEWLKQKWASIVDLFGRIIDWVRDIVGNLDIRVARLREYYKKSVDKTAEERKDVKVIVVTEKEVSELNNTYEMAMHFHFDNYEYTSKHDGTVEKGANGLEFCLAMMKRLSQNASELFQTYGRVYRDKTLMNHLDLSTELYSWLAELKKIGKEKKTMGELGDRCKCIKLVNTDRSPILAELKEGSNIKDTMIDVLNSCAQMLKNLLKYKQAFDMLRHSLDVAKNQAKQLNTIVNNSDPERLKGFQEAYKTVTNNLLVLEQMFMRILQGNRFITEKVIRIAASYTNCVKPSA